MNRHQAMIEAGPGEIRQLCCGTGSIVEPSEVVDAALGALDDRVALVGGRPMALDSLWRTALQSLACGADDPASGTVILHPSWWSPSRIGLVAQAVESLPGEVLLRPRSWLSRQVPEAASAPSVVVEIAERLVAIVGTDISGIARTGEPRAVAEGVARAVSEILCGATAVVLVDAPAGVSDAPALAALIAREVRDGGASAIEIDAARLVKLALSAQPTRSPQRKPHPPGRSARCGRLRAPAWRGLAAAAVVLAAVVPVMAGVGRHGPATTAATTFLVEGRVAMTVPANWVVQRMLAGPGSARVQITSPADPEVAMHMTQSLVPPNETLAVTAERLQRAMGSEPVGVFVDLNASGTSAGRPAVTYREVRASHQVRWTVLLDGLVRISVGCQSRPGGDDAVRDVCEQAVRSARAVG
ncbi:type VII secretion-associated protein [Mycobacterium shigaense]|uniref:type VII secretion-associated protein n=1 Tax=Mycobacterium shigaense TaxID=722731 RepID=UPI002ADFC231|nr:type VII secretion-associated protein [Mycobacterium shigaense]MEA1124308.1 type VII secretion-associated protein [Mycobacterium shigaense]